MKEAFLILRVEYEVIHSHFGLLSDVSYPQFRWITLCLTL